MSWCTTASTFATELGKTRSHAIIADFAAISGDVHLPSFTVPNDREPCCPSGLRTLRLKS